MSNQIIPIVGSEWGSYSYLYNDGMLARIQYDVITAKEPIHTGYSMCIRPIIFIHQDNFLPNGQPRPDGELASLLNQQQRLIKLLTDQAVQCRFVGAMFYGGMFDLVFQVEPKDSDKFNLMLNEWVDDEFPYRIEVKESSGWDFYDTKIRPSAAQAHQQIDRQIINKLIEAGSDPTKLHQLEHVIQGTPRVLRRIARKLKHLGFLNPQYPQKNVLMVYSQSVLDPMEVWNQTGPLVEFCEKYGATYDCWGAEKIS